MVRSRTRGRYAPREAELSQGRGSSVVRGSPFELVLSGDLATVDRFKVHTDGLDGPVTSQIISFFFC